MNRNVTFSLPAALIKKAKICAAEEDSSLNALVRRALEHAVEGRGRYQEAGERLLRRSKAGLYEITPGSWSRDELHERTRVL